jgi:hypothetical protein
MENPNKKVYCINSECGLKGTCARYSEVPKAYGINKKFEESWNGKQCIKYRAKPTRQPRRTQEQYIRIDEPIAFYSTIPQEVELREHLVRQVTDNFDRIFVDTPGISMDAPSRIKLAARLVDFMMPKVVAKRRLTESRYK